MQINLYPTPKSEFQTLDPNIVAHRQLISSPAFKLAINTCLLQYSRQLTDTPPTDFNGAAANYLRLLGAQEFVKMLHQLSEQTAPPQASKDSGNLLHRQ
jgi:hypothetical protein